MEITFKYEMGQEVTLRGMVSPFWGEAKTAELKRTIGMEVNSSTPTPQKMIVVGRIMDECHGGIQLHYRVRIFDVVEGGWRGQSRAAVIRDVFTVGEFELIAWTETL
jgi:hypothetical protein